ncbi:MAG: DUF4350 domain-containing protein [Planctomycetales bacterium]|nr:DUF4350 domain-containing protein [Planctomycetales bacterium]
MPQKSSNLLSARNAIVAAAGTLFVSLAAIYATSFKLNDSDGWGRDTFGTRGDGYRGVYELLQELQTQVDRSGAPPQANASTLQTLVLLDSNPALVAANPAYLQGLVDWVDRGGRLVVAPGKRNRGSDGQCADCDTCGLPEDARDIIELLDLDAIVEVVQDGTSAVDGREGASLKQIVDVVQGDDRETTPNVGEHVRQLAIPAAGYARLALKTTDVRESLGFRNGAGEATTLIAVVQRGAGEIVVIAEPALFANSCLGLVDNSVVAANLMAVPRRATVFDEFYHGLAVRGNPLYVLTKPGFAAVTLGLVLAYAGMSWRAGAFLGPPLPSPPALRRHIGEYVNAMGRFFLRAPDSGPFLLREIRDGVLRHWSRELGLPLETSRESTIVAALRRRDPQVAARLETVLAESTTALSSSDARRPKSVDVSLIQRLVACR